MRNFLTIIITICIFNFGCKKDAAKVPIAPDPARSGPLKISIINGAYQTAPLGSYLQDSIVVKVTVDKQPAKNIKVEFKGSGCNAEFPVNVLTKADGTASYRWQMVTAVGDQKLTAVVINDGKRIDSVTLTTKAYDNSGYVHYSSCTPPEAFPLDIQKLSSGRLLTCFSGKNAIRYSDDYGLNWLPLKSLSSNYYVTALVTTPNDEIFAVTQGDGIFYSKNAGISWADVTPPTFNKSDFPTDVAYTKSGKLIITSQKAGIFISSNKGQTWVTALSGLPTNQRCNFPVELNNGNLYVMDFLSSLYKSTDGGLHWVEEPKVRDLEAICVDKNGWMYKANFINSDGVNREYTNVIVSKDDGKTFTSFAKVNSFIFVMKVEDDGLLYFWDSWGSTSIKRFLTSELVQPVANNATIATFDLTSSFSNRNWFLWATQYRLLYFSGHNIGMY